MFARELLYVVLQKKSNTETALYRFQWVLWTQVTKYSVFVDIIHDLGMKVYSSYAIKTQRSDRKKKEDEVINARRSFIE